MKKIQTERFCTEVRAATLLQSVGRGFLNPRRVLGPYGRMRCQQMRGRAGGVLQRSWRCSVARGDLYLRRRRFLAAKTIQRWVRERFIIQRWRRQRRCVRAERCQQGLLLLRAEEHRERTLLEFDGMALLRSVYTLTKRKV